MKQIAATIDGNGRVVIEVDGVKGRACLDLTRDIERAIGVVRDRNPKPELNEQEVQHGQQAAGGR